MIDIVDAGLGNLRSVANMVAHVGGTCRFVTTPDELASSEKILLPGVGAFDAGMRTLRERHLEVPLKAAAARGARILGICLGMQLLFEASDEGTEPGLSLIPGNVKRFDGTRLGLKVPHMGWNAVRPTRSSTLFPSQYEEQRFYFVHSYYVECASPEDVTAVAVYGIEFACAVERGRVYGVQFHPEKSHRFGMNLLKLFSEL